MARRPSTSTLGFVAVATLASIGSLDPRHADRLAGARHDALRVPGLLHVEPSGGRRRVEPERLRQLLVFRPVPRNSPAVGSARSTGPIPRWRRCSRDPDRVHRHRGRPADLDGRRPRLDRGDHHRPRRRPPGPSIAAAGVAAVVALFLWRAPLRETVSLGQAYALMLALQAVALWAIVKGRAATAGVAVGAAVAAKLAAVPLLLLLAVRGSFRSVAVALGTAVVLAGLTVGFAGFGGWCRVHRRPGRRCVSPTAQCRGDRVPVDHWAVHAPVRPGVRSGTQGPSPRSP